MQDSSKLFNILGWGHIVISKTKCHDISSLHEKQLSYEDKLKPCAVTTLQGSEETRHMYLKLYMAFKTPQSKVCLGVYFTASGQAIGLLVRTLFRVDLDGNLVKS